MKFDFNSTRIPIYLTGLLGLVLVVASRIIDDHSSVLFGAGFGMLFGTIFDYRNRRKLMKLTETSVEVAELAGKQVSYRINLALGGWFLAFGILVYLFSDFSGPLTAWFKPLAILAFIPGLVIFMPASGRMRDIEFLKNSYPQLFDERTEQNQHHAYHVAYLIFIVVAAALGIADMGSWTNSHGYQIAALIFTSGTLAFQTCFTWLEWKDNRE
jgi:hypothetical protein